jgi:peptidoglycan/LPS O-acetylase OafA/YrhL
MYLQMSWVAEHPDAPIWMNIVLNIGIVIMAVFIAWACFKLYDLPVRNWLTEHWLKRKQTKTA